MTGDPVDDPSAERPRPRYGEYATPEEVARARGARAPDAPPAAPPGTALPRPLPPRARPPRRGNNLITVLLLLFGIWNTVDSIPGYLDFGSVLSQAVALAGYGSVEFGAVAHTAGIVLLVVSLLLLIAAIGVSLRLIRDGRRSIWVPITAGALSVVVSVVVMTIVVANTPSLLDVLHNH